MFCDSKFSAFGRGVKAINSLIEGTYNSNQVKSLNFAPRLLPFNHSLLGSGYEASPEADRK